MINKKELIIGKKYFHTNRKEKCVYTENCVALELSNYDPDSVFMEFNEDRVFEVSLKFIEERI